MKMMCIVGKYMNTFHSKGFSLNDLDIDMICCQLNAKGVVIHNKMAAPIDKKRTFLEGIPTTSRLYDSPVTR